MSRPRPRANEISRVATRLVSSDASSHPARVGGHLRLADGGTRPPPTILRSGTTVLRPRAPGGQQRPEGAADAGFSRTAPPSSRRRTVTRIPSPSAQRLR